LFRIDAKHRNLKQNENETKRKLNEKRSETAVIFASVRNEAKRKRNYFCFDAKTVYEMKLSEKNEKQAETSKRKRIK
jgi:hypothetical protein